MDAELKVLSRTLHRTLTSLQNKRDYLLEQQHNYIGIRGKLLILKDSSFSHDIDSDDTVLEKTDTLHGEGNEGLLFKDIIITSGRCYLNIGYEYYVEKEVDECLKFVDDKLNSIDGALVQFDKKIKEANDTMKGMSVFGDSKGNSYNDTVKGEEEEEEEYQMMEIREELDDEGNVVSSSVTPKPTEKDIEKLHESMVESMQVRNPLRTSNVKQLQEGDYSDHNGNGNGSLFGEDFKKNLKGKLLSHKGKKNGGHKSQDSTGHQEKRTGSGGGGDCHTKQSDNIESINENPPNIRAFNTQIATDNIYTFDDLVRQLDEQDELEDGIIDEADIDYSLERFDRNNIIAGGLSVKEKENSNSSDNTGVIEEKYPSSEEEYDDDDDDASKRYSIVPNTAGRLSFMDQINKLRSPKLKDSVPESIQKPLATTKKCNKVEPPRKSILKKTVVDEGDSKVKENDRDTNEKKKKQKNKKKKTVGFAESLDIYEVENLKEETRKQTVSFPRMPIVTPSLPSQPNVDENGFDSDLFAQLIGARNPDELHDKYQEKIREIQAKEDAHLEKSRERRVSRFRMERHASEGDDSAWMPDDSSHNTSDTPGRAVTDIVEHDIEPETQKSVSVGKRSSKFAQRRTQSVAEVTDQQLVSSNLVDTDQKSSPQKTEAGLSTQHPITDGKRTSRFAQRMGAKKQANTARISLVNKEMKSLLRPRPGSCTSSAPQIPQKILEELDGSGSDDDHDHDHDEEDNGERGHEGDNEAGDDGVTENRIPIESIKNGDTPHNISVKEKLEMTRDNFEFPEAIKKMLKERGKDEDSVRVANVDYSGLNKNLDDMARAYTLGLYDDDLEEHPGTLVEKLDDFKPYNKQVDELKDEIDSFKKENPLLRQVDSDDDGGNDNADGSVMVDVVEHDLPEDYTNDTAEDSDNYSLNPDKLSEEIRKCYFEKREYMIQKLRNMSKENDTVGDVHEEPTDPIILPSEEIEGHELEPADENGNPVKVSRFKAKRLSLRV